MSTQIRTSSQVYIDADLDFKGKKASNLADGAVNTDAATVGQMNTAIANATSGVGTSIHAPVADLAGAKAVNAAGRADRMLMLIESLGLYHFDAEAMTASNDGTVIRPTDIGSDASAGRWIKMSATITDHDLLSNILGNGGYHLSQAERDKLTGIATGADVTNATSVGSAINGAAAKATPVDGDVLPILDSAASFGLKNFTWANLKSVLKTYFDGMYQATSQKDATGGYVGMTLFKINFKNVANTITSFFTNSNTVARTYTFQDRDGTIADNTDIASAKDRANHTGLQVSSTISDFTAAAQAAAPAETTTTIGNLIGGAAAKTTPVDADMIGVSDSAASNVVKKFTFANLKTWLGSFFSGDITVTAGGVTAIGANKVTNAQLAQIATQTFKGRTTAGTGNVEDLTLAQVKTLLGLTAANTATRVYRATPTGTINGSNTVFTISALVLSGTEVVIKNGLIMNAGASNDYTISYGATTTITFTSAPSNAPFADIILVDYSY